MENETNETNDTNEAYYVNEEERESRRAAVKEYFQGAANSILFRMLLVGFLIILLLIPSAMIRGLIKERQKRKQEAAEKISSTWPGSQTLGGPVLTLHLKNGDRAHFMPDDLKISGTILPEVRKIGIFKSVVYKTELEITGVFLYPDVSRLQGSKKALEWEKASLSFGLTDLRGVNKNISILWNETTLTPEPGLQHTDIYTTGVYTFIPRFKQDEVNRFSMKLSLKGSNSLFFLPLGKQTRVNIDSPWPSPGFTGKFFPNQESLIDEGFSAEWRIYDYNRNFPQMWLNQDWNPSLSYFGVELVTMVDEYQKTERSTKYAILFIALTFLTFFLFIEIFNRGRIHPIQYLLVGFGLSIFYLLLLSLSEHIRFDAAYGISSLAVIVMTSLYSASLSKKIVLPFIMGALVSGLYGFLYVILQLEEYSLLMGSTGLFIILGVVMFVTRKINFYSFSGPAEKTEPEK